MDERWVVERYSHCDMDTGKMDPPETRVVHEFTHHNRLWARRGMNPGYFARPLAAGTREACEAAMRLLEGTGT